jgi:hypothetical protein
MVTNATHMEAEMTSGSDVKRVTVSVCASDDDTHLEIEVRHNADGVWLVDPPSFTLRIAASELDRAMCAATIIAKRGVDE